jgi:hypothetical protein
MVIGKLYTSQSVGTFFISFTSHNKHYQQQQQQQQNQFCGDCAGVVCYHFFKVDYIFANDVCVAKLPYFD